LSVSVDAFGEEPVVPAPPEDGGGGGGIARNTAIFSFLTGLSRVVGLLREIVFAGYFGTTGFASAFAIAYQVPNYIAQLFAQSALSAAFVPVFTDLLQQKRRKEAVRLASTLFWLMLIGLGAITAVFILAAGFIMPLFIGPKFGHDLNGLTVGLSRVLFPVILLLGLNGLLVGSCCSRSRRSGGSTFACGYASTGAIRASGRCSR
jgi:putative peptidoglycan lipid II flippase